MGMMEDWTDFVQSPEEIKQGQEQAGMAVLKETRRHLLQSGLTVNETFSKGYVAEEVIRIAEQLRVDLVVVGSKETNGRKKFPLGRVPRHVVRHAPCSVLVVRPRENDPRQVLF